MPSFTSLRRAVAAAAIAGALTAVALPAQAHAELVSSDPQDGATVTELTSVRLEFSEDLLDIGNSVTVTDSAGTVQELVLTFPESNVIEGPVSDLAPGAVTIAWRNAAVDGHTEEGELNVTLAPPVTTPSPDPTPEATLTEIAQSPAPVVSVTPISAPAPSGPNPWLLAVIGLVVIGGAAAAIVAAARRKPGEAPGPDEAPGPEDGPGTGQ